MSFLIGTPKKVHLPLVAKSLLAPVLNAIPTRMAMVTTRWLDRGVGATSYTLEEDDNATFTGPTTQYAAGTSSNTTGKAVATYHYRAGRATAAATAAGVRPSQPRSILLPVGQPSSAQISKESGPAHGMSSTMMVRWVGITTGASEIAGRIREAPAAGVWALARKGLPWAAAQFTRMMQIRG